MFSAAAMDDDNWDLSAVVRSCRPSSSAAAEGTTDPFWSFPPPSGPLLTAEGGKGGAFMRFPDVFESRTGVLELAELYSSSFPGGQPHLPQGSSWSPRTTTTAALAGPHQSPPRRKADRPVSQTPRSRRRKNQQKKVVRHVPADGLSSDMWAWRKYGQKPIKGSPYPRGYYRCSSSKGCPARKQVERSRTDPAMFIIAYTAEHNHPVPTHRSSLAGSTRHKFPSPPPTVAAAAGDGGEQPPAGNPEASPLSTTTAAGLSPTTPLTSSMEDELLRSRPKKGQAGEDEKEEVEEEEEDDEGELLVEDMEMMGEDDLLFLSSEEGGAAPEMAAFFDGDGGFEDPLFPLPWLSNCNNTSTTAATER